MNVLVFRNKIKKIKNNNSYLFKGALSAKIVNVCYP